MKHANNIRAVTTVTPLRVSFVGGGTDIASFYQRQDGAVISTAINKYVYVTVKRHSPLFNEAYRLSYSKTEHVDDVDAIENDIARECLRLVTVEPPLFISTVADLPVSSGLGSSSAFAVGLLYALHCLRGEEVAAGQLAEEACQVEIDILKRAIGKQDQYVAAFGGLNYIQFQRDGRVLLDPLWLPPERMQVLFGDGLMLWSGMQRDAHSVLSNQAKRAAANEEGLAALRRLVEEFRQCLLTRDAAPHAHAALLDRAWRIKRNLAAEISNVQIDAWYAQALAHGALGGKLLGAGGGGFLYLVVPQAQQAQVRAALALAEVPVAYEPRGARILSIMSDL